MKGDWEQSHFGVWHLMRKERLGGGAEWELQFVQRGGGKLARNSSSVT